MTLRPAIEKVLCDQSIVMDERDRRELLDEIMPLIEAEIADARADEAEKCEEHIVDAKKTVEECDGSCPHLMSCPRFKIGPPKKCNGCFDIYCDCHLPPTL